MDAPFVLARDLVERGLDCRSHRRSGHLDVAGFDADPVVPARHG
jgi:hypothetical protein